MAVSEPPLHHACVSGNLRLVPEDAALDRLAVDYPHKVDDGLFLDDVESFDDLLAQCRTIEGNFNAA